MTITEMQKECAIKTVVTIMLRENISVSDVFIILYDDPGEDISRQIIHGIMTEYNIKGADIIAPYVKEKYPF